MTHTMRQIPEAERVLILAPHPDDEALGCGGTIALYSAAGIPVYVAVISDGGGIWESLGVSREKAVELRQGEARAAGAVLGIREIFFLGLPDGRIKEERAIAEEKIAAVIDKVRPDIIYSSSPVDCHEDHIAVAEIAMCLLQKGLVSRIAYYEIYETVRFNTLVDISGVQGIKKQAVRAYGQSLFHLPELFFNAITGMNRARSLYTRNANGLYEAFWIVSASLSRNEMLGWLTFGLVQEDSASHFLSQLKAVDGMLYALRGCRKELAEKTAEMEAAVAEAERGNLELRAQLKDITGGLAWKAVQRYYRIRDKLFPEKSFARRIYERTLLLFRKKEK